MSNVLLLSLAGVVLYAGLALAEDHVAANCPLQLQTAQTHTLVVAESRHATEQKLAIAVRANQELSAAYQAATAEIQTLKVEAEKLRADLNSAHPDHALEKKEPKKEPKK